MTKPKKPKRERAEYFKEYRKKHRAKLIEYSRQYKRKPENQERLTGYWKKYRAKYPDRIRERNRKYRERKRLEQAERNRKQIAKLVTLYKQRKRKDENNGHT